MTTAQPCSKFRYPGTEPSYEDATRSVHDLIHHWLRRMLAAGAGHGVLTATAGGGIRATWHIRGHRYAVEATPDGVTLTRARPDQTAETVFACPAEFVTAATTPAAA